MYCILVIIVLHKYDLHRILTFIRLFFFNYSVASWFISPLLSGFMSGVLFLLIRIFILKKVCEAVFLKLSFRTNFGFIQQKLIMRRQRNNCVFTFLRHITLELESDFIVK